MDPDVARMMADLGNARRDILSAPEEECGRVTERAAQSVRLRADHVRAQAGQSGHGSIRAWNTPSTFAADDVAEQMENRFSGQGHRAALAQACAGHRGRDAPQAAAPPERARRPLSQDRSHGRMYRESRQARGRAPTEIRERPPSPRSQGHVKFKKDQRVHPRARVAAPSVPARAFTFQAPPSSSPAASPAESDRSARSTGAREATAPAVQPASGSASGHTPAAPRPTPPSRPPPASTFPSLTPRPAEPVSTSRPVTRTRAVAPDHASTVKSGSRKSAKAAAPDTPASIPVPSKPISVPQTATAASDTASNAPVSPASNPVLGRILVTCMDDAASHTTAVPAAVTAEEMVAEGLGGAPATKGPDETFTPAQGKQPVAGSKVVPLPPLVPSQAWRLRGTDPMIAKKKIQALFDAEEKQDHASQWRGNEVHFLYQAQSVLAEDVVLLAQSEHSAQAEHYFKQHKSRAWLREFAQQARQGLLVDDPTVRMTGAVIDATRRIFGETTLTSAQAVFESAPAASTVPVQIQAAAAPPPPPSSTVSDPPAGSVTGDEAADSVPPAQLDPARGSLDATFYDRDGNFCGVRRYAVDAPVQASVTITAGEAGFNVLEEMSGAVESFAAAIRRREVRDARGCYPSENGQHFDGH